MNTDTEEWRQIADFPNYSVSNLGRIRHIKRGVLAGHCNRTGYLYFNANVGFKKRKTVKFHRLACETFHGPPPSPKHVVAHKDGNRQNNAASNLRWATTKENHSDRYGHGTDPTGSRNPRSKLTEKTAAEIRARYANGEGTTYELADMYGVFSSTVQKLINRETWKHVA